MDPQGHKYYILYTVTDIDQPNYIFIQSLFEINQKQVDLCASIHWPIISIYITIYISLRYAYPYQMWRI